jgi:hypothetical protein
MTLPIYPLSVRGMRWPSLKSGEYSTIVQKAANFYETRIVNSQNPIWHWSLIYEYLKDNPQDLVSSLSPYTDYRYLEGFLLGQQGQFAEFLYDDLTDDVIGLRNNPGGTATYPSAFKVSIYPTQQFFYPAGSYLVDTGATPHLQLVTIGGISGTTVPSWNQSGGTTTSGTMTVLDQGVFSGSLAQTLPLVTDGAGGYYSPIQRNFGGQFLEDVTDLNLTTYASLKVWANGYLQTAGVSGVGTYQISGPGLAIPGYSYQGLYIQWWANPATPITALGQFYFRTRLESDSQDIEIFLNELWTIGGESSKNGSGLLKIMSSRVANV